MAHYFVSQIYSEKERPIPSGGLSRNKDAPDAWRVA